MTLPLEQLKVAFLSADGVEQIELEAPLNAVRQAGASACIVSIDMGRDRLGGERRARRLVRRRLSRDGYRGASVCGARGSGWIAESRALRARRGRKSWSRVLRAGQDSWRRIGSACSLLIAAKRRARAERSPLPPELRGALEAAGGIYSERAVNRDQHLITCRSANDLPAFCGVLIEQLAQLSSNARVDEASEESFPASDAPAWGPAARSARGAGRRKDARTATDSAKSMRTQSCPWYIRCVGGYIGMQSSTSNRGKRARYESHISQADRTVSPCSPPSARAVTPRSSRTTRASQPTTRVHVENQAFLDMNIYVSPTAATASAWVRSPEHEPDFIIPDYFIGLRQLGALPSSRSAPTARRTNNTLVGAAGTDRHARRFRRVLECAQRLIDTLRKAATESRWPLFVCRSCDFAGLRPLPRVASADDQTASPATKLRAQWAKLSPLPGGRALFSRMIGLHDPVLREHPSARARAARRVREGADARPARSAKSSALRPRDRADESRRAHDRARDDARDAGRCARDRDGSLDGVPEEGARIAHGRVHGATVRCDA